MSTAPALLGVPLEFIFFGLTLLGIAAFHKRALAISVAGLLVILAYEAFVTAFPTGRGAGAFLLHLEHEWVLIANLLLLLIASRCSPTHSKEQCSESPADLLPDDWTGGLALWASSSSWPPSWTILQPRCSAE